MELFKIFNEDGPDIKVTLAPRLAAASANEKPILPEEKLPINLTGSIFSYVGPADISMFFPLSGNSFFKFLTICLIIFEGSIIRPFPIKPLAKSPVSDSKIIFPKLFNLDKLSWLPGCLYMSKSMDGATKTGHLADK